MEENDGWEANTPKLAGLVTEPPPAGCICGCGTAAKIGVDPICSAGCITALKLDGLEDTGRLTFPNTGTNPPLAANDVDEPNGIPLVETVDCETGPREDTGNDVVLSTAVFVPLGSSRAVGKDTAVLGGGMDE